MITVSVRRPVRAEEVAAETTPEVARVLNREMQLVGGDAKRNLKAGGHIASSKLWQSIQGRAEQTGPSTVDGWIGGEPYWPYVETGTRPHWPPIDPLIRWVRSKKIDVSFLQVRKTTKRKRSKLKAQISFAYMVQAAIAKRGTKPHPFVEPALAGRWERLVDNVMKAVARGRSA